MAPVSAAADRCEAIAGLLSMPEGGPVLVEGHHRLILRTLHAPGRVEVIVLLPKGNGKTTIFGVAGTEHLLTTPNAQCFVGASDTAQADEMYRFMSHFSECEEELAEHFALRTGTREIRCTRDRGFAKVLASDSSRAGGKRQAFNPTLFLCDELHGHENPNLYVAGRSGVFKRGGRMGTLSTAGHDLESVLGRRREKLLNAEATGGIVVRDLHVTPDGRLSDAGEGRLTVAVEASGNTVLLEWACRDDQHPEGPDDLTDSRLVKLASPASFASVASIDDAREALEPWVFARYRANVWTLGSQSWLPPGACSRCATDTETALEDGAATVLAVDMARYSDCAAVVAAQAHDDRVLEPVFFEQSGGENHPVDYEAVKQAIRDACDRFEVLAIGYDPKYFDQSASELEREGFPMEKFAQSNERMSPAWKDLRRRIINRDCRLAGGAAGEQTYMRHMTAGKAVELGQEDFVVRKPSKHVKIDLAVATAMADKLADLRLPDASVSGRVEWV